VVVVCGKYVSLSELCTLTDVTGTVIDFAVSDKCSR